MAAPEINEAIKIPELKKRLIFTLAMLVVYRLGIFVPTPGIDAQALSRQFQTGSGTLFGMINMFSGGALENFSVFALGIMPYISVSIIVQLLTTAVKRFEELQKEGEQGRRILTRYTRIGTIVLALFQGYWISVGLEKQNVVTDPGMHFRLMTAITLTAGTSFIMWLGEQISERGIGNGMSIIIFAGIVARMPATLLQTFDLMSTGEVTPFTILALLTIAVATVAFIVFVERCQRRIPVQYPRRAVGRSIRQAQTQHLPLKLNTAGVIPAVFASAFLVFPATIAQFAQNETVNEYIRYLSPGSMAYEIVYCLLILFFCFFYTAVVFDPQKISEDLKKNGGFVPTVRPGRDTATFLGAILSRVTLWGALYICIVCTVPTLAYQSLGAGAFAAFFGGTAVLIVVGVTLDTAAQIQSFVVNKNYEVFLNNDAPRIRGASKGIAVKGQLIKR